MKGLTLAKPEDAQMIVDLYAKVLNYTGFKRDAAPENRSELTKLIENLCKDGKIWFIADHQGPAAFGHYEADKNEVITVATRDDAERKGFATAVLQSFVAMNPRLTVRPVTRGGLALAKKCGFVPSVADESVWVHAEQRQPTNPE